MDIHWVEGFGTMIVAAPAKGQRWAVIEAMR